MSVDLDRFVRTTPLPTLRKYLADVARGAFESLNWKAPRASLATALSRAIEELPGPQRDKLLCDVDRVCQFEGAQARQVLRSVLPDPNGLETFDALQDVSACALHVLMLREDIFENALAAVFAQRLLNGRYWTGFDFEPGPELALRQTASLVSFGEKLREIFGEDGPRPRVAVERFTRRDPDPAGTGGTLVRQQFTIYVEGAPEAMLAFAGAHVQPQTVRPVHEAAILFDNEERLLDVVARGGGKMRRQAIADAFVSLMMAPGARLAARSRRTLSLDVLKRRPRFDWRLEDRIRSVDVSRLVMSAPDHGSIATFEVSAKVRAEGDLYARAERAFGRDGLPARTGWTVRAAKLRITFEPETKTARAKTVTFEMKTPDRTNLRDQIEVHRRIADTLLARWGLYAGVGSASAWAATGDAKEVPKQLRGRPQPYNQDAAGRDTD